MLRLLKANRWPVMGCVGVLICLITSGVPAIADSIIHTRFEVSPQGLNIKGSIYGKNLPLSTLKLAEARVVDLNQERDLKPFLKMNGVGLPSYKAGWFRLKDGRSTLAFLTPPNLAVYIPTTEGFALLVSPAQPAAFLAALQNPPAGGLVFALAKSR